MISIYALPSYVGHTYSKHVTDLSSRRLSSRIRGEEIANYLGVKFNPPERDGVCIHIKPKDFTDIRDGDWVDFLDSDGGVLCKIKNRPKVKVIAASLCEYEWLKKELENEVFLIPNHHLNWDRLKRTRKEVTTCGYIGNPSPEAFKRYDEIRERLKRVKLDLVTCFNFKTRQDALDLYSKIDIFVAGDWDSPDRPNRIPTKIINAASFGIPTICFPLQGNLDIEGYYVHSKNIDDIILEASRFKDENYYNSFSERIINMAERYHISKMPDYYNKLT
jgi:hypothetical protein